MNFINISVIIEELSFFVFVNNAGYSPIIIIIIIIIIILFVFQRHFGLGDSGFYSCYSDQTNVWTVRDSISRSCKNFCNLHSILSSVGSFHPCIEWVPGFCQRVKQPKCETNHSPASSLDVKNQWRHTCTPPICLHGVDY